MSSNQLIIYFAYRTGDDDELKQQHFDAFEQNTTFEVQRPLLTSAAGSIEISSNDIPGITGMSFLDNYEHESDNGALDLLYAPLVRYTISDLSLLEQDVDEEKKKALDALIDAVVTGYNATEQSPLAVVSETPPHQYYIGEAEQTPFTAESLLRDEYQHLSWLSVFTPPMVRQYGRETLHSAPAWKTLELDDGSILIVCHDDTVDWQPDCRGTAEHIGLPWYEDIV